MEIISPTSFELIPDSYERGWYLRVEYESRNTSLGVPGVVIFSTANGNLRQLAQAVDVAEITVVNMYKERNEIIPKHLVHCTARRSVPLYRLASIEDGKLYYMDQAWKQWFLDRIQSKLYEISVDQVDDMQATIDAISADNANLRSNIDCYQAEVKELKDHIETQKKLINNDIDLSTYNFDL